MLSAFTEDNLATQLIVIITVVTIICGFGLYQSGVRSLAPPTYLLQVQMAESCRCLLPTPPGNLQGMQPMMSLWKPLF